jgi:hypothetical protein
MSIKLVRFIKLCLNETYNSIPRGKQFLDTFPIQKGLKQRETVLAWLSNFALEYAIRKVPENPLRLKPNVPKQLLL